MYRYVPMEKLSRQKLLMGQWHDISEFTKRVVKPALIVSPLYLHGLEALPTGTLAISQSCLQFHLNKNGTVDNRCESCCSSVTAFSLVYYAWSEAYKYLILKFLSWMQRIIGWEYKASRVCWKVGNCLCVRRGCWKDDEGPCNFDSWPKVCRP